VPVEARYTGRPASVSETISRQLLVPKGLALEGGCPNPTKAPPCVA
jgi:hypothetical protein